MIFSLTQHLFISHHLPGILLLPISSERAAIHLSAIKPLDNICSAQYKISIICSDHYVFAMNWAHFARQEHSKMQQCNIQFVKHCLGLAP
ncbi:hypothetical protein D3C75_1104180 [compost metagenome]